MDKRTLIIVVCVAVVVLAGAIIWSQARRQPAPPEPGSDTPLGAAVAKFEKVFGPSFIAPPGGTKLDDARQYAMPFCAREALQTDDDSLARLYTAAAEAGSSARAQDSAARDNAMAVAARTVKTGQPPQ